MWNTHYNKIKNENHPPSHTLNTTLKLIKNSDYIENLKAIDLGCGNGIDTIAMLERGFDVLAIDKNAYSLKDILISKNKNAKTKLLFKNYSFESITHLPSVHLINASFSLPFCKPNHFKNFWRIIHNSINFNGFFCGHFFGLNDTWSTNTNMTFCSLQEVKKIFIDYDLLYFEETSKEGKTLSGKKKHWHVFHVVAKKVKKNNEIF